MRDSEKTNCHHEGSIVMPQKSKLNAEEKVEIIRKYQQGEGTVKYYAQIHLQVWQNSVCTGQGNLPLIT